jgi:hypothetical protein
MLSHYLLNPISLILSISSWSDIWRDVQEKALNLCSIRNVPWNKDGRSSLRTLMCISTWSKSGEYAAWPMGTRFSNDVSYFEPGPQEYNLDILYGIFCKPNPSNKSQFLFIIREACLNDFIQISRQMYRNSIWFKVADKFWNEQISDIDISDSFSTLLAKHILHQI